jgi:hypothetical protein
MVFGEKSIGFVAGSIVFGEKSIGFVGWINCVWGKVNWFCGWINGVWGKVNWFCGWINCVWGKVGRLLVGSLTLSGIATGSSPMAFEYVASPYDRATGQP